MAFQANIPQPTDQLAISQADILNNFSAIMTLVDVNHVDFASSDQGKHKWVTFPVQTPSPPITFNAGELALYSFTNATTSQNELYINKTNQVTVVQIPLTASILSVNSAPGNNVSGWTYLPSGIIMKWGNSTATGATAITFPTGGTIPVFTNVMSILLVPYTTGATDPNTSVTLGTFSNTGFNAIGSTRTAVASTAVTFQYLAIGY